MKEEERGRAMTKVMEIDGVKVRDADPDEALTLHITQRDVKSGSAKNAKACAAAKALCRQEGCEAARVHLSRTYVKRAGTWVRYMTPPPLRSEIIAFDRGGQFSPGDYTLGPVQPIVRFGSEARKAYMKKYVKRKPSAKHPQKGNRAKPHVVSNVRQRMSTVGA
jgi:hypothetical protein